MIDSDEENLEKALYTEALDSTTTTLSHSISTATCSGESTLMSTNNTENMHRISSPSRRSRSSVGAVQQSDDFDEVIRLTAENKQLKSQLRLLTTECQTEQDTVAQLRKRLNAVERERLASASKSNEEMTSLESTLAKLTSQIERGEAARQNLEFELTQAQRLVNQEKRGAYEREGMISDVNESMKQKILDMNHQIEELQGQLQIYKKSAEDEETRLRLSLEEKEKLIATCHTEQDILEAEKEKLETVIQQHELNTADMEDKIKELEDERKAQGESLRHQVSELDHTRDRENRLKQELELAMSRVRQLEEGVENERAAHLESKFNSEIIQLRVRDLESALDVEKTTKVELSSNVDKYLRQLMDLEKAYEEERKMSKHTRSKLEKTEREYENVRGQLVMEVNDKKSVINELSKQLEIHQKNFDELKSELAKAKKRQVYLEETYGGSMRELELLLDNFQVNGTRKDKKKYKKDHKPLAPNVVLETLRHTLLEYQKRLDNTSEELLKMKALSESLSKECATYKDMIWVKDKSLEETQLSLSQHSKELNRLRNEHAKLEDQFTSLKIDLQMRSQECDTEKTKYNEVKEEIVRLAKKYKAEDEEKHRFLHNLYQRLLAGRILSQSQKGFNNFSWIDLSSLVQDQITSLLSSLQRQDERVKHLEQTISAKDKDFEELHKAHEMEISKIIEARKQQEVHWLHQKQEQEDHFNQLLSDVNTRSKKTQSIADQAWEKVRMTGNVQQGLEVECAHLQDQLLLSQQQQNTLLTTCILLIGAYYPTYTKATALASQRNVLDDLSKQWDSFRSQAAVLVETLGLQMNSSDQVTKEPGLTPKKLLLRFRAAAIAIMAANRLCYFGQLSMRMFTSYDSSVSGVGAIVCSGGIPTSDRHYTGLSRPQGRQPYSRPGEQNAVNWLTNPDHLNTIMATMSELNDIVHRKESDSYRKPDPQMVITAARNSFHKLMDKFSVYFDTVRQERGFESREKSTLVRYLACGLQRALAKSALEERLHIESSQQIMSHLQQQIYEFISKLHKAEVKRRNLHLELNKLKQENSGLKHSHSRADSLQNEVEAIKNEKQRMVGNDRFESVCSELDSALKREQQAQQLLNQQSGQLQQLSQKLDVQVSHETENQHNLQGVTQDLSQVKYSLKSKEQQLHQLETELFQMQGEKKGLHENMYDAEKALRSAAQDKDSLCRYLQGIESALLEAKKEMSWSKGFANRDFSLSKMLMSADLIPLGKPSGDIIAMQNVVSAFIDVYQQCHSRLVALQDEIEASKRHVATLKRELAAACRRELHEQVPLVDKSYVSRDGRPMYEENRSYLDEYSPLQEDEENPSWLTTPITKPNHQRQRSMDRSPYRPPLISSDNIRPRSSNTRP